jgi:hypothetical protein
MFSRSFTPNLDGGRNARLSKMPTITANTIAGMPFGR